MPMARCASRQDRSGRVFGACAFNPLRKRPRAFVLSGTLPAVPQAITPAARAPPAGEFAMLRRHRPALLIASVVLAFAAWIPSTACAQDANRVVVAIYHVAPGKHLEFLRWQAARDAAATEAGIAATQWYAHLDGDSWDYVSI